MKRKVLALLLSVSTMFAFSGCSEASKVSHNLSLEADNFNDVRQVTVINCLQGDVLFQMTGKMSITADTSDNQLEVVVEDEIDLEKINVGCKVKVFEIEEDEEMEFRIVGSTEANSLQNKISNESPVGRALLGKKVGDIVDVETQIGVIQYKVLEIQRVS